jgi:DNA polymerase-3 subunit beta
VRIICNQSVLHEALQHVGRVVSGRTTLPILGNVLLEAVGDRLRVVAYDMEIGAQSSVATQAEEEGAITVPARVLADVVASLPAATVEMQTADRSLLRLTCGRSQYRINGLPAEEYPALPEVPGEVAFEVAQAALREMIRTTVFAVSTDETRAILTGVLLRRDEEGMRIVATDSYRLALRLLPKRDAGTTEAWEVIIPARALQELSRMLDPAATETPAKIRASEQQILFEVGPYTLISRLIEGQFPNYQRLLQQQQDTRCRMVLNRQELLAAIRRAAIMARAEASKLIFRASEGSLKISAESADLGQASEELPANIEGGELEIGFNAEYLTDVLAVLECENVTWELTGPLSPGVVRASEDPDYLYVVMPMQL